MTYYSRRYKPNKCDKEIMLSLSTKDGICILPDVDMLPSTIVARMRNIIYKTIGDYHRGLVMSIYDGYVYIWHATAYGRRLTEAVREMCNQHRVFYEKDSSLTSLPKMGDVKLSLLKASLGEENEERKEKEPPALTDQELVCERVMVKIRKLEAQLEEVGGENAPKYLKNMILAEIQELRRRLG